MISRALALVGIAAAITVASPRHAAAQSEEQPRLYQLEDGSALSTGCFGPCLCPVLIVSPVKGTFSLRRTSVDPLFTTYEVSDVRWTLPDATNPVSIRGSGTYRVGGEFAVQEQMVLDLTIGANAPQRFDSGLVAGGGEFPAIDIRVFLNQAACIDTVIDIKAKPAVPTSAEGDGSGGRESRAISVVNPFRSSTNVRLSLTRPEQIDIDIFDPQGRLVRHLAHGRILPAGTSSVPWDGLSDRGAPCAAGVYLFRVQSEEHAVVRRAAKLK